MNDDQVELTVAAALQRRFPVPADIDILDRLDVPRPARVRRRVRVCLAASASALVAAGLGIGLNALPAGSDRGRNPGDQLIGVAWRGPDGESAVFTDHTAQLSDGCATVQRRLTISGDVLALGAQVSPGTGCGGPGGPPSTLTESFDHVMNSERLSWSRTGDTLRLTDEHGESALLKSAGPALPLEGTRWSLIAVTTDETQRGDYSAATMTIVNGQLEANDLCNDIGAIVTVTDTTVTFSDVQRTAQPCANQATRSVAAAVDSVLSGTANYLVFNNSEVELYDAASGTTLTYTARG